MSVAAVSAKWKPYPAYKPSGVDWLGEIPTHWKVKRIKYIAPVVTEKLHEKPEDLPYIGLENVESGTGRLLMEAPVESVDSVVGVFKRGDVLFGKLRPYLAKVVNSSFEGVCTSELVVLRPPTEGGRYLSYQLLSRDLIRLLTSFTYGTKMPRVSPEQIAGLAVAVPPTDEQRTISAFLDRETAKIDALVAKKERLIELLQEKRTALITRAVTKGLNPSAPMKDSGVEWLGNIPAHWEVNRLMYLTPDYRPIMYGIVLPGPNVDDGVPIVKAGDVAPERLRVDLLNRTTREIEAGYTRSRLHGGDIVYAIRGSIGAAEIVPAELEGANLTQDAARVAPSPGVEGQWLLFALKSKTTFAQLDAGAMGAAVRGINIRDLKRAVVAVPPIREQHQIAAFLAQETMRIDALIDKIQRHIRRFHEYRGALISAAVTGKIEVRGKISLRDDPPD